MNTITTKLYKSGNSYSVRVPMGVVKYLGLKENEPVTMEGLRPARPTKDNLTAPIPQTHTHLAGDITLPLPLSELQAELRRHGVVKASVFGSFARGEARADSDLDLLVQLAPGRTYLDLGGLQYSLAQKTNRRIDIATHLNKHFAAYAEEDMVEIL